MEKEKQIDEAVGKKEPSPTFKQPPASSRSNIPPIQENSVIGQHLSQPTSKLSMDNVVEVITPEADAERIEFINSEINVPWNERLTPINYLIDFIMLIVFYLFIFSTILFALCNIYLIITDFFKDPHNDTAILRISEHIFLSLLPIFIVFGFFHYYKNNTQNSLIGNRFPHDDDGNSTKTMNLTKTLFLSSIISYIMIKIIELIFSTATFNSTDIWKIILSVLLLTILIIYFIFLNKMNHDK